MRRLLNILTAFSLLLCCATLVMTVRGRSYIDGAYGNGNGHGHGCTVRFGGGEVSIEVKEVPWPTRTSFGRFSHEGGPNNFTPMVREFLPLNEWSLLGVGYHSERERIYWVSPIVSTSTRTVTLSYWLIVLLTLILPKSRILRSKRTTPGLCPICHYDLRATPDRCPECGNVPAAETPNTNATAK